jgi:hypothetical protein
MQTGARIRIINREEEIRQDRGGLPASGRALADVCFLSADAVVTRAYGVAHLMKF